MRQKQLIPYGAIRSALRKLWMWSWQRKEAIANSKVARGNYRCSHCGQLFGIKEIHIHHTIPVGKFINWDMFITNLFCAPDGLEALCEPCHKLAHDSKELDKKKKIK